MPFTIILWAQTADKSIIWNRRFLDDHLFTTPWLQARYSWKLKERLIIKLNNEQEPDVSQVENRWIGAPSQEYSWYLYICKVFSNDTHLLHLCPSTLQFLKNVTYVVFFKGKIIFLKIFNSPAAKHAHTFLVVAAQTLQLTLKVWPDYELFMQKIKYKTIKPKLLVMNHSVLNQGINLIFTEFCHKLRLNIFFLKKSPTW